MSKFKHSRADFDEWEPIAEIQPPLTSSGKSSSTEESADNWAEYPTAGKNYPSSNRRYRSKKSPAIPLLVGLVVVAIAVLLISRIAPTPPQQFSDPSMIPPATDIPYTEAVPLPTYTPYTEPQTEAIPPQIPSKEYRYFGNKLNDSQKQAYDTLVDAIFSHSESVPDIHLASSEELKAVMNSIYNDYAELYWFTGGSSWTYYERDGYLDFTVSPNYCYSQTDVTQMSAFLTTKTQPLLNELSAKSDYEKVKGVYEYLIDNTAYDYAYHGATLYDLFYSGGAVCEGYTRATQYLLQQLDIEVIYVVGFAGDPGSMESHAWNIVKVDGDYYHLDVTWGDPLHEDGTQTKNFNYLCITTDEISRNHSTQWDEYPVCNETSRNYFRYEGNFLETYDPILLQEWIADAHSKGIPLQFKTANENLYNEVKYQLFENQGLFDLLSQALGKTSAYQYTCYDDLYILSIEW